MDIILCCANSLEFRCGIHGWNVATIELRDNTEVVDAACSQEDCALELARERLRGNRDIVLRAVSCHGIALRFASIDCCSDDEIVWEAVLQSGEALQFAEKRFLSDVAMVLSAVSNDPVVVMEWRSKVSSWNGNTGVVMRAVAVSQYAIRFARQECNHDI